MNQLVSSKNYLWAIVLSLALFAPLHVSAGGACYGQGAYYSQPYYQSYYQTYYQSYYQSGYYSEASYGVTFTTPVTVSGDAAVSGSVGKGGGSFVIDHPLDPFNKLLFHSFVESPDAKNIYDGIATLDANGEARVQLPDYFEALNKDFSYEVKPIGTPMPNLHIKEEVKGNTFVIGGGVAGGKVSWQVTGTRQDPYIVDNPIQTEVPKGPDAPFDIGEFAFPEGYSKPLKFNLGDLFGSFNSLLQGLF